MDIIRIEADDKTLPDGKTPLRNISEYSPVDVLCGRGGGTNHHAGNNHWRALVSANKRLYISLPKKQKVLVARSIVHAIRSQVNPHGGRFLQRDAGTGLWGDIGDQKATEKTSQALREGAPDIRTEMEQQSRTVNQAQPPAEDLNNYLENYAMALGVGRGGYKPGQILPSGLITLDYEGVQTAMARSARGPLRDGTIDISHSHPPAESFSEAVQQLGAPPLPPRQPMDPMMQAFQQFMGVQQQNALSTAQGSSSSDPVSKFQQLLTASPGQEDATAAVPAPAAAIAPPVPDMTVPINHVEQISSNESDPLPSQQQQQSRNDTTLDSTYVKPKLPLSRVQSSEDGSDPSLKKLPEPVAQTTQTREASLPGTNIPPSLGQERSLSDIDLGDGGAAGGVTQALEPAASTAATHGASGSSKVKPAPSMTREMALHILLREKAHNSQKARREREDAAASEAEKFTRLKSSYLRSLGVSDIHPPATAIGSMDSLACGLTGGLTNGLSSGFAGSLMSTQLLADYLSQRNSAAAVAPLPVLGNISSMSDEQIREALRRLERQKPGSSDDSGNPYSLVGPARGPSLPADPLGASRLTDLAGGTRLSDTLSGRLPQSTAQTDIDKYTSKYANLLAGSNHLHPCSSLAPPTVANRESLGLAPSALANRESLGLAPSTLANRESLGLQQAIKDAMQYLGPYDATNLEASESLGPTPLRPGVSATLAQLKVAGLNSSKSCAYYDAVTTVPDGATRPAAVSTGEGDRRVFWVPPPAAATAAPGPSTAVPTTFKNGTTLGGQIKMTPAPERMETDESLDDLCRAAGMYLKGELSASLRPRESLGNSSIGSSTHSGGGNTKKLSRKTSLGLSQKMKMFQGLMDCKQTRTKSPDRAKRQQPRTQLKQTQQLEAAGASANDWALAQEWENVKKVSSARRAALKLGKNDQSLVDDSDEDEDDDKPIASFSRRRSRQSFSNVADQRAAKRHVASHGSAKSTAQNMQNNTPSGTVGFDRGVSFLRDVHALPMAETILDRGHSLAMSEISLDRGQSVAADTGDGSGLANPGDEGQFDDASEEGGAMNGKVTIGNISTLPEFFLQKG